MQYLDKIEINRIDSKLKLFNKHRPLPKSLILKLKDQFAIEMTYNSNGIEGNSLTLKETFLVINEGLTVKNKPLKDHLEAKDHFEAIEFLAELVENDRQHTISERLIRNLHQIITRETEKEQSGKYRDGNVIITGSKHRPPEAFEISRLMSNLVRWTKENQIKLHPIELSAIFHHKLVFIHPFFDGNGRTARLAMNLFLMQKGYPLVVILKNDRKKYYDALAKADRGDWNVLIKLVSQSVERSLNMYLRVIEPKLKKQEKYQSLSQIASKTRYSTKYLNLLARKGKIEAHKEGRDWLSTLNAIEIYIANRKRKK
ncbi:MAG: Fic family protein [Patescibacteria group bacterium]